jgi:hypothetical protein
MRSRTAAAGPPETAPHLTQPEIVMSKRLAFTFVAENVTGFVDLHEKNAPVTCATIWKALRKPIRGLSFHAMFAGPEIMLGVPPEAQTFNPTRVPAENQTVSPGAGDLLWFYQGRNMMKGLTDELWELGLFYDNGGRTFGPLGWTPVNIFGTMTENLPAFAACCRDIRMHGAKMLEVRRA